MIFEVFVFILGLVIGSFLNVCIHRIPREASIVSPPSSCPGCGAPIRPYDNIPLISYLLLGGKCRSCGMSISARYPLVELLNGLLYASVLYSFGTGWHLPFLFAFVSSMIIITFIDLDFQIIPDVISLPGIAIGLVGASLVLPDPFGAPGTGSSGTPLVGLFNGLTGAVSGFGLFYLIAALGKAMAKTDAMGGGDLKMMAMIGAFMGWKSVILTTFVGSLAGSVVGIALMVIGRGERKMKVPFGPFLAAGALVSLFFGGRIVQWYLGG
jgi:leader peptidase (prepilin peptidase)/N-methyltransferase